MTDELKPCPFCGGRPNSWHHRSPFGISNVCDVYCNRDDHNVVVTGNSLEEAIAAWNARHEPAHFPEWEKEAIDKMYCYPDNYEAQAWNDALDAVLKLRKPEEKV